MSRLKTHEVIAGETIRVTYDAIGATANPILSTLWSGSETLVGSVSMQDSGNGYYYALHQLPTTPAWYVNKVFAYINPNTYVKAQYIKAISPEVD